MVGRFDKVTSLLLDKSGSLVSLAKKSGIAPFEFYRGADLSGLDLSGQDLRGLNFQGANLNGCRLDNIRFDVGAFNGALLSHEYFGLYDEFTNYIDDIDVMIRFSVMFYGIFRRETLEGAIRFSGFNYGEFCARAGISEITLRSARRGQVVANTTLSAIGALIKKSGKARVERDNLFAEDIVYINPGVQPCIRLLSLDSRGGFDDFPKEYVNALMRRATELNIYSSNWGEE